MARLAGAGTADSDGAVGLVLAAALGVEAGVGAPDSRCPQCWQKAKPDGVCLPQEGQVALPGAAAGAASAAGMALGAANDVPHILQKFIPAGLLVPQALQTIPEAAAAGVGLGAGASSRWPQS
jgi:hypothetical protein